MISDANALPALLDAMSAAGNHDTTAVLRALDAAESHLPKGYHKSRADIVEARTAANAGEWQQVWRLSWAATTGLTWAFPPDISLCPPMPDTEPFTSLDATCQCGAELPRGVRFCPICGQPNPSN